MATPHLLRLPTELRDIIWTYVFINTSLETQASGLIARNAALLAVNHQTRSECAPLYFKLVAFTPKDWHLCTTWLVTLTPECRAQVDVTRKKLHARTSGGNVRRSVFYDREAIIKQCNDYLQRNAAQYQQITLRMVLESPGIRMRIRSGHVPEYICQWKWDEPKVKLLARSGMRSWA